MTNYLTYLGVKYSRPALLAAIVKATMTTVVPGTKFHDRHLVCSVGDKVSVDMAMQHGIPVLSMHDGKYFVIAGTVTEEMIREGFAAKFISKYNLLKARLTVTKPPPPTK